MIYNEIISTNHAIQKKVKQTFNNLGENVPVSIDKYNEDGSINVKSLVDNREFNNVTLFTQYGIVYNKSKIKYGILYYVPYEFISLLKDGELIYNVKSSLTQYGVVFPIMNKEMLEKYKLHLDDDTSDISIYSQLNNSNIKISDTDIKITHNKDDNLVNSIDMNDNALLMKYKENIALEMNDNTVNVSNGNNSIVLSNNNIEVNSDTPLSIKTNIATLKEVLDDVLSILTDLSTQTQSPSGPCTNPTAVAKIPLLQTKLNGVLK